ncbi:adventurous-gliding motility protein Z-like isoform X2 [Watersipora subatra]|uniref:adventurous-gliding motility protein Z-like isoform X2 n=1 Tax=Watersipora subatra TaxID=2589382 RepID=UPI00355B05E3
MRFFTQALLALTVAAIHAAPQNGVVVESEKTEVEIASAKELSKGDERDLFAAFQNDQDMVKTCLNGVACEFMTVAEARMLEAQAVNSVEAVKGEPELVKALTPSLTTMTESINSLQAQKALLENLEASMAALRVSSMKGQELAQAANTQFANSISKGVQFSPASKGPAAPAAYPYKGMAAALPPSKGANYVSNEAMLCPMTMYELGKCQKLSTEMKVQMDSANAMNAQLLAEKQRLENQLAVSEMMRQKAEEQAAFNAKYAAEQKAQAEALANGLAQCNTAKNLLEEQKASVEAELADTQSALADERQQNDELTADLAACNEDKAQLTDDLADQTARAEAAEEQLAATKALLEEEIAKTISLEETLGFTKNRLSRCESDLTQQRTAREETEEELMRTMTDLTSCENENKVLGETLRQRTSELTAAESSLARETAAREMLQAKLDDTVQQLRVTEENLRRTRRLLEDEQNAHTTTRRILQETQEILSATEESLRRTEEARQVLEDELAECRLNLDNVTNERDQLQATLETTSAALAECTTQKGICDANLMQQTAIAEELSKQLTDAMLLLNAEKEAREQLMATIVLVQETSLKVQEEVKKLQTENILLQQQVEKLQAEQGVALALAAGCPPTYEKFGSSCYKYVREKTQWKMAQEQCMKDSGNLVAIESTQEQLFVTNYLKRLEARSDDKYIHMGAFDYRADGSFTWVSSNIPLDLTPTSWLPSNPRGMGRRCTAIQVWDMAAFGEWADSLCWVNLPFVCEIMTAPPFL